MKNTLGQTTTDASNDDKEAGENRALCPGCGEADARIDHEGKQNESLDDRG